MINVCNSFPGENLFEISLNMCLRLQYEMHVAISMAFWSLALSSRITPCHFSLLEWAES